MSDDNTQLARRDESATSMAGRYEPQNFDELARLSKAVVSSGLAPNSVRKPEDAMVILMTGAELGLRPMQSLRSIHVVKGKPVLSADLMKAVVERSGLCERWDYEEMSSQRCKLEVKRQGRKPMRVEWTMADAKRANLLSNDNWRKYPSQMLRHRCDADAARAAFPDLLMGMYTPNEIDPDESVGLDAERAAPPEPAPDKALDPDVVDARFEEVPPQDDVHWSAATYDGEAEHESKAWTKASERFHAVLRDGDCSDLADEFKAFVKARHDVESCKQIPPDVLHQWSDLVSRQSHETTISEAGDPVPSPRWEWMRAKLDKASAEAA